MTTYRCTTTGTTIQVNTNNPEIHSLLANWIMTAENSNILESTLAAMIDLQGRFRFRPDWSEYITVTATEIVFAGNRRNLTFEAQQTATVIG